MMKRKRIVSVLLVVAIIMASINFDMSVKAVTNTLGDLMYFTGASVGNNFNIKGKYNGNEIQITYNNAGYSTYYKTDTMGEMSKLNKLENGASQTTSDGLKITQNLSFFNNERYVRVTYTVENTNTESKTFSIGSCADVQIAANDNAAIKKTTTGLRMSDVEVTGAQFNLIARNAYGVTDVDTLWYGPFNNGKLYTNFQFIDVDSSDNIQKTNSASNYTIGADGKVTSFSGRDSSICYSWDDRPIGPGSVQEYSVMIGIGSDAEPPVLDINSDVYMNLTGKSRGSSVDVSASFKDAVGRQDSIFYAFDNSEANVLKSVAATGVKQSETGSFIIPETWEDNSLHLISLWLMNDKGAMSDTKKVYVYINPDNSNNVQEAVPYSVIYASGGATGTGPSSASVYEKNNITLPSYHYSVPLGKKFGGWSDGTLVYPAGASYTMPSHNVTMTATWINLPITLSGVSDIVAEYGVPLVTDANNITASGGSGSYIYNILPSLPAGMTFSSDGKISGTPSTISESTSYTVTGVDTVTGETATKTINITVAKRFLTVTGAACTTKIYDGTDSVSASFIGDVVFSGKLSGDDVAVTTTGGTYNSKNVSSATTLTLNGLALTGNDKDKYQLASNSAVVTGSIFRKIITVKIDDAVKKVGTALPVFGVHEVIADGQSSALVNGDTISSIAEYNLTTVANADSPVGTYSITGTAQNINSNYSLTINYGALTVTQNSPSLNSNYVIEGTLNSLNQWYNTDAIVKPFGSYDKIKSGTDWADSITVSNSVSNVNVQLKNSTTGEITSVLANLEIKSDSIIPVINVTGNTSEWKKQETFSVLALAGISGIKSVTVNGTDITSTYGNGYTITQNGTYVFIVTSNAGLTATKVLNIINIDNTKPENPVITGKDNYTSAKWYNTDQTITASFATTPGSPERLQYSLDAGATWVDGATYKVTKEAVNTVQFRVMDAAGNSSDPQSIVVQIDKTKPETAEITAKGNSFKTFINTITFGLFYNNNVDVTITANDSISGIKSVEYQKVASAASYSEAGTWTSGTSLSVAPDEKFIVYARITDKAGNVTIINTDGITTDNTDPTLSLSDVSGWKAADVNVQVTAGDILAGIKEVTYTTDEKVPQTGIVTIADGKGSFVLQNEGQYKVTVAAKDNSGNTFSQTADIKLDKTKPVKAVVGAVVDSNSKKVTGTAEPGSVITVKDSDGKVVATGTAGTDGTYSITISKMKTGTILNVVATDNAGNSSDRTEIKIIKLSNHVSDMIDALPNPETATADQILSVQNDIKFTKQSYDALDEEGRSEITADRREKLNKLLTRLSALVVLKTKDVSTGVAVDGIGTSVVIPELDSADVSKVEIVVNVSSVVASVNSANANIVRANTGLVSSSGQEILVAYDISLIKSVYGTSGTLTSTGKVDNANIVDYITVRIPVPSGLGDRNNLKVVYIDDNGNVTSLETKLVTINGELFAEFRTNHFSEYAIVADVIPVTAAASTATGDNSHTERLIIVCMVSSIAFVTFGYRRKKVKRA